MSESKEILPGKKVEITKDGSLGLLALGDVGLRAWREVRNKITKEKSYEEE
ncbi:hypothetical protein [Patiriisocius marinus]|uniref:Uncharacterized protein n=1 Tax=Patiriisocius marinus TaxID=1397112 RepID=A0A5J4J460_9FLAO|nr:hypothetical protein [Patiriisocius marinus]GER60670.1 hypothetical protein ULMA_27780 [Patiriisocius marinus]